MEKAYFFRNSITRVALLLIILTSSINCGVKKQKYFTHPNAYLVNQLANKKIIMLADFAHSYPLPYKSLIFLLDKWLEMVKSGESKSDNIVLVLEADTQEVSNLKNFIATGNLTPLIKFWLPYNTLEWIEFCEDLRNISLKVKSFNEQREVPKIYFDILAGETFNVFDNPEGIKRTREEDAKFFVNIRDSLSAKRIINYLAKNKNKKAIIFYGNMHLIKSNVHKNVGNALPESETKGFYLAHYLIEKFGADSVLSINQWKAPKQMLENSPFAAAGDSNIFVYSRDITWENIPSWRWEDFDGFILRREEQSPAHYLAYIFSKNVIEADISRMQYLEKYLPGALAERYYNEAKESLQMLTGQKFNKISEWQTWFKENNYDGINRLDSKEFEKEIFDRYYNNPADIKTKLLLRELGFGPAIMGTQLLPKLEWESIWKDVLPKIKYLDAVGVLWVGTTKEKIEASKYLLTMVHGFMPGQKFKPQDYLKLYRKYYERVDY
ncbi:MAG: hypothetical protein M1480_18110 [Bacteroidetes bacterium]|nr:hypothetical protein [Bacteroidota bacterium]